LLCTVYRPPDAPISFLEDLTKTVVESLLQGVTAVLLGDLNCDVLGNGPDGRALNDFCLRFNLAQMVKSPKFPDEKFHAATNNLMSNKMKQIKYGKVTEM